MRRIVTGLNGAGRSTVISTEEIEGMDVWEADVSETPIWMEGQGKYFPFEASPGQVKCLFVQLPPDEEQAADAAADRDDGPVVGLHKTRTIDLVYVLDPLDLVLEEETVELQPGDLVVQRGTMHDWKNRGSAPARVLGFSWGVGDPAPAA